MNSLKALGVAVAFLLPAQSYAVDSRYSFREIRLGDDVRQAEAKARQQFDRVELDDMDSDSVTVMAGDTEGLQKMVTACPIAAPSLRRPNCLRASFSTRRDGATNKVQFINATQSFNPAVPLNVFLKRLNETYGTPRTSYKNTQNETQSAVKETLTLLWGGTKIPSAYSQSATPWDDFVLIGGAFVSVKINVSGTDVIGYRLWIADAEKLKKAEEEARIRRNVDAGRAKKTNADRVKF